MADQNTAQGGNEMTGTDAQHVWMHTGQTAGGFPIRECVGDCCTPPAAPSHPEGGEHTPASGARSHVYGHAVRFDEAASAWLYEDTGERVDGSAPRPCPKCSRLPTTEGHDACLGTVPGVSSACCGHGVHEPFAVAEPSSPGEDASGRPALSAHGLASIAEHLDRLVRRQKGDGPVLIPGQMAVTLLDEVRNLADLRRSAPASAAPVGLTAGKREAATSRAMEKLAQARDGLAGDGIMLARVEALLAGWRGEREGALALRTYLEGVATLVWRWRADAPAVERSDPDGADMLREMADELANALPARVVAAAGLSAPSAKSPEGETGERPGIGNGRFKGTITTKGDAHASALADDHRVSAMRGGAPEGDRTVEVPSLRACVGDVREREEAAAWFDRQAAVAEGMVFPVLGRRCRLAAAALRAALRAAPGRMIPPAPVRR